MIEFSIPEDVMKYKHYLLVCYHNDNWFIIKRKYNRSMVTYKIDIEKQSIHETKDYTIRKKDKDVVAFYFHVKKTVIRENNYLNGMFGMFSKDYTQDYDGTNELRKYFLKKFENKTGVFNTTNGKFQTFPINPRYVLAAEVNDTLNVVCFVTKKNIYFCDIEI